MGALADDDDNDEGEPMKSCPYCGAEKTWRGLLAHVSRKHKEKRDQFIKVGD